MLSANNLRIPIHVQLLQSLKPADALINVLGKLLPELKTLFPKLVFLCDAGLTCDRLLNFLMRLVSKLGGFDFKECLLSLVYPPSVVAIARLLEFAKGVAGRCLRFSPFPDDRLFELMFQDLIGGDSYRAKV